MKKELLVQWTTDNMDTAMHMVILYAYNAKKQNWFDEVTLLIWGASQKIAVKDVQIQEQIQKMEEIGVKIIACKKCAQDQNIENDLISCGVNVFYTGELLTEWLLSKKPFLSV